LAAARNGSTVRFFRFYGFFRFFRFWRFGFRRFGLGFRVVGFRRLGRTSLSDA
jgi:hypothetical protein